MKSSTSVISKASSIAQSTASQVEVKMRTNQTKAQLRALMKNIDLEKTGLVKEEAFFTILKLHGIDLDDTEKNRLKKGFSRASKINYSDALHSINIDLDSAVLNEEKWTVPKQAVGGKAQEAQNSLLSGKAVTHLSRMSLQEFEQRQQEMDSEIYGDVTDQKPKVASGDSISKAGSSVTRSVQKQNLDQLNDFRSKLGAIMKSRPEDAASNVFDGVSVQTPAGGAMDREVDNLSVQLSKVGVRDLSAQQPGKQAGMAKFITNLMASDKPQYERLVELMRLYNRIDVDLRLVSQLKTCFISKDQGMLTQIPLGAFKDAMKGIFTHFRQVDEIMTKTAECVETEIVRDGMKQKMADSGKLFTLIEFIKCFPLLVKKDKNTSSGMNYVMQAQKDQMRAKSSPQGSQVPSTKSNTTGSMEVEYVKQLLSLVLGRMEEKHRNITDVFRFMDQRGKGKVRKSDFVTAVERMRISLAREDVTKVWNYIDSAQQGFIQLQELSIAFQNRIADFNKQAETAIETMAVQQYKHQEAQKKEQFSPQYESAAQNKLGFRALNIVRKPGQAPQNTGQRSPIRAQGMEYTYGIKNMHSDNIGQVVQNTYMAEAAKMRYEKEMELKRQKNMAPKGLVSKPTVTSKLRQEANRQTSVDHLKQSTPGRSSFSKRNMSMGTASNKILPPLKGATVMSKRDLQSVFSVTNSVTQRTGSQAGSYHGGKLAKNAQNERVLFPTMVKESFLQRNKHIASVKMEQMAADFANRGLGGKM